MQFILYSSKSFYVVQSPLPCTSAAKPMIHTLAASEEAYRKVFHTKRFFMLSQHYYLFCLHILVYQELMLSVHQFDVYRDLLVRYAPHLCDTPIRKGVFSKFR